MKFSKLKRIVLLLPIWCGVDSFAQSYFVNGTAKSTGNQCYQLTSASNNQNGSVWYADQLDLNLPFDLEFTLYFGDKDDGADGIVFVLQTVGTNALGQNGGGIGFQGFSPSIGIEFDDWQNTGFGDPSADHIGIFKNGSVDHTGSSSLAGPISANSSGSNIEDGKNHPVRIIWDPATKTISVYFDCSLRLKLKYDMVQNVFSGKSKVYWGITSATGGANNTHIACLRDDIIISDTFRVCKGDQVQLNARQSKDNSYLWQPSDFLSSTTVQKPVCKPTSVVVYTVTYKDVCGNAFKDTVTVLVSEPFPFNIGPDTTLCNGASATFKLTESFDVIRWENGQSTTSRSIDKAGKYWVEVWKGFCKNKDEVEVKTLNTPSIIIQGNETFCTDDSVRLDAVVTPPGQTFTWNDGYTKPTRYVKSTGGHGITAQNICGQTYVEKWVRELPIDPFDLGPDENICPGDTVFKMVPLYGPYTYLWNNGDDDQNTFFTSAGLKWFKVNNEQCSKSDSFRVIVGKAPILSLPKEILLCHKQTIELDAQNTNSTVVWNGVQKGSRFALFEYEGNLHVHAANACGADSMNIDVTLVECFCDLYFPNAVSPNYDGLNEGFKPVMNCQKLLSYELKVFNRWGELLYKTNDAYTSWDLNYNGKLIQAGVYYWMANYVGIVDGLETVIGQKGSLTVLR